MQPLATLPAAVAAGVHTVLADIDDTITTDGRLEAQAYSALERLQQAGLRVIPVTGRPAGWCDMIARFWPVEAVVGENGAFSFRYDRPRRRMQRRYAASEAERVANREKLDRLAAEIVAAVPGAGISADQPYRVADLAIDFCEDVQPLPRNRVLEIVRLFEAAGATAKVSSIHVNGWFGNYDKLAMAQALLSEEFALDLARDGANLLFVGDSPNDEPMFKAFPISVGVANVVEARELMRHLPPYVSTARSGAGFVEVANHLLRNRR